MHRSSPARIIPSVRRGFRRAIAFLGGGVSRPLERPADLPVKPAAARPSRLRAALRPDWRFVVWRVLGRTLEPTFTLAAAGVAYYAFLAIFPSLAMIVSLYGLVMDRASVAVHAVELERLLPNGASQLVGDALVNFVKKGSSELNVGLVVGFLLALYTARAGTASLMSALNVVFGTKETRGFLHQQAVAVALALAIVLLGIAALAATSVLPLLLDPLPAREASFKALVVWLRWPILAVVAIAALSTVYRFAPCRPTARWRPTFGSVVAGGAWIAGSILISFYVSFSHSYDAIYGSLAAVVILLLWLWVTALVTLLGGVIDAERERVSRERARFTT